MADSVAQQKYRRVRDILNLLNSVRDEGLFDSLATISDQTREVREGNVSHTSHLFEGISDDADADILIKVGDSPLHIYKKISAGGPGFYRIFQDTTVSDNGTELIKYNRNREFTEANGSEFYHSPTVTDTGTQLGVELILGANDAPGAAVGVGAASEDTSVWVLKPNTNYLIRYTNKSGGSVNMSYSLDHYAGVSRV